MSVRTVVFDVGMTLVRPEPSFGDVFAHACAERGVTVEAATVHASGHLWRAHDDAWHASGLPSPFAGDEAAEARYFHELYERFLDAVGASAASGLAGHLLERLSDPTNYGLYPEVPHVLDDLAGRGLVLGIVSNWGTIMPLRGILERTGIIERFATVVVSGEVGVAKPDPAILQLALDDLGEDAGPHAAYVGDDPEADVAPARALGLTAVLVDRTDRLPGHDGPRVRDLTALPEALGLVP